MEGAGRKERKCEVPAMSVRLNITVDEDVYRQLKRAVPPKRMSAFITEAVRARLFPDRRTLDAAYRAASKEAWRRRVSRDWRSTEIKEWPE
jgi:hypothetical protein